MIYLQYMSRDFESLTLREIASRRGDGDVYTGMRVGAECSKGLPGRDIAVTELLEDTPSDRVPVATVAFYHAPWDGQSAPHETIKIAVNKPLAL